MVYVPVCVLVTWVRCEKMAELIAMLFGGTQGNMLDWYICVPSGEYNRIIHPLQ